MIKRPAVALHRKHVRAQWPVDEYALMAWEVESLDWLKRLISPLHSETSRSTPAGFPTSPCRVVIQMGLSVQERYFEKSELP